MGSPSKSRVYATVYIAMLALANVVAFAAIPPYRTWAIGSLIWLAISMYGLTRRENRFLLGGAYVLLALISAVIGVLYWEGNGLSGDGLLMLLVTLPIFAFTLIRIAVVELGAA